MHSKSCVALVFFPRPLLTACESLGTPAHHGLPTLKQPPRESFNILIVASIKLQLIDADHDGLVSFDEFLEWCQRVSDCSLPSPIRLFEESPQIDS